MYEERRPSIAKGFILKLLLFVVIIILIVWLFPTKSYVSNLIDSKLGTSKEQVFNNNLNSMKQAALSYYNGDRLPQNDGDSDKITLEEMLQKKILIAFTDSNGKECNKTKSYVKITKNKNDYSLKVNLSCQDGKNYIISYIDSSGNEVYAKKKITEDNSVNEDTKTTSTNNSECEYVKIGSGYYSNYGSWSNWSTNYVKESNTRNVETKTLKEVIGTDKVVSGTSTQKSYPTKLKTTLNGQTKYVYVCPSDYDNAGAHDTLTMCLKTVNNYKEVPLYKNVTYYRYQDRKYISSSNEYKWSSCNDSELTNQGFTLTGNKR